MDPFTRLSAFPECPPEELRILAHAILAARSSGEVHASLRMAKRVVGLDAARWLNGSAFAEYGEPGGGYVFWDELQPHAAAYLGETP
jgi:hypothetical protein